MNVVAIIVAIVAHAILGSLWYSPVLFAKPWAKAVGISEEEMGGEAKGLAARVVGSMLMSVATITMLAWLIDRLEIEQVCCTALLGGTLALVFFGAASVTTALFERTKSVLVAINVGYQVVALSIAGAILGAFG